jgi:arsenate reductase (glutaredoxin)
MSEAKRIEVFHYPKCSTCRKALKWLEQHGIEHTRIDIVEHPPSETKLARAKQLAGVELRKLFNTSGQSYKAGNWKDTIATIPEADALAALAADGKLIKRPLLIADDFALVGFAEPAWAERLDRATSSPG